MSKTIETYVDVDLDEWCDEELIEEMRLRGYSCIKGDDGGMNREERTREDWQFLLEVIDRQPANWFTRRVRDKVVEACYG
jgi:hypothetical protein